MNPRPDRPVCPICRKYPAEHAPFYKEVMGGVIVPVKRCIWCARKEGLAGREW